MAQDISKAIVLSTAQKAGLVQYAKRAQELNYGQNSMRAGMEEIDRSYMREKNYTREQWQARTANWRGDATKIQDVTVPIVMPQVESALTYLANVFTTGYPIFGVVGDPGNADAALMMQTINGENAKTAGWTKEMIMFFRDGLKYNIHGLECEWSQKVVWKVGNNVSRENGAEAKQTIWNGNRLNRLDMYNTFFDTRVPITEVHERGEFAGYIKPYGRTGLRKFISEMLIKPRDADVEAAFESASVTTGMNYSNPYGYYMPIINPFPLMNPNGSMGFDWLDWAMDIMPGSKGNKNPGPYELMKLYCRIVPEDLGIQAPDSKMPQVWKLYIVNREVLLYAERQTNAHNMIPMFFGQPIEDGLQLQTKSYAQNVGDMQSISSALANGYIATMRRNVSDRGVYNPMYISHKDMASTDPAAKIPVKPAAYGKPLTEAYLPIPFRADNAQTMLAGVGVVVNWANTVNGQNPAQQGQFVKGNKTQQEYDDTMGHGNGRNQLMAIMCEAQVFTPMKEVIKLNILQYQQNGPIYSSNAKSLVDIDVTALREAAVEFEVSDGLLPTDKLMSTDAWNVAIQVIGSSPDISQGYNRAPMFSYMMKQQNVDLSPFEKSQQQMMFEQQTNAWQQAAMFAAKSGQPFTIPQPVPSPELQQEMQAKQANGGVLPGSSNSATALALTQGGTPRTAQQPQPSAQQNGAQPSA